MTIPLPVEKGNALAAFIRGSAGCSLYQSAALVPGTCNIARRPNWGKLTLVFSSIHWIPSINALAGNGTNGTFNKYVFAPGMLSTTVPPSVAARIEGSTVGEI
jgi:hypothetical protein